jgi:hypothetical protein
MLSFSDIGVLWPLWLGLIFVVWKLWGALWDWDGASWIMVVILAGGTFFLTDYAMQHNPGGGFGGGDNENAAKVNALTRRIAIEEGSVFWIPQMFAGMPSILVSNYGPVSLIEWKDKPHFPPQKLWFYLISMCVWPLWALWRWGEERWKWVWGAAVLAAALAWLPILSFWWIMMCLDVQTTDD